MLRKGREERSRTDYCRWWDQDVIELKVARAEYRAAEAALEEEVEEWGGGRWKWVTRQDIDADGAK